MAYALLQSILEEAGFSHAVSGEVPSGAANGSNKVFTVGFKPLSDANYSDVVDKDDVKVYVDGVPATVSSIDALFGTITLATAPAIGSVVTVDYKYSPVSMQFVSDVRAEAEGWINTKLRRVDNVPYGESAPATVRYICRLWSAAQLLLRDYGFNNDTEQTSKDGAAKLKMAKTLIQELIDDGGAIDDGVANSFDSAESTSSGDLFESLDTDLRPNSDSEVW